MPRFRISTLTFLLVTVREFCAIAAAGVAACAAAGVGEIERPGPYHSVDPLAGIER